MKKVLVSNKSYPIVLDSDLNPAPLENGECFNRSAFSITEECEVYINGKYKYTAKPGDVLFQFYGIENRYEDFEYFLVPSEFFGDYFVRLEKIQNGKQSNINSVKQCCDCAESIR